jgi:hypothetical protein
MCLWRNKVCYFVAIVCIVSMRGERSNLLFSSIFSFSALVSMKDFFASWNVTIMFCLYLLLFVWFALLVFAVALARVIYQCKTSIWGKLFKIVYFIETIQNCLLETCQTHLRHAPTATDVNGPCQWPVGAVVAALGSARAHSAPLPHHLPIESPHRPRPICYDPTRASRPWRLGLAAPPPSSLSPSSSSPPPPASKVTTAFAIRDPIPISLSRSFAVVPTGNLSGHLPMPRWSGARSAWFPHSRRGNGLRSLLVGLRRSGLGFGPSLRGLDSCCLFSDCGGMRSCGNGWNLPSERSAVTEVLRASSYFVVSVGSTLVKQISDHKSYCCRISE